MKKNKDRKKIFRKFVFPLLVLFFFLLPFLSFAAPCAGTCRVFGCSFYGEIYHSGDCSYYQNCCIKASELDTSGADPDPIGAGLGAGGTLQDPNTTPGPGALGSGAKGGTVTPGTSGITTPKTTASSSATVSPATVSSSSNSTNALVPCGLNGTANCTLCHLVLGFKNIYDYLLKLLLVATTLVVVVAGVMYMVSSGSKGMIDKAKSALTYALTAMILGLLAWLIINATLSALGYTKVGNWYTFTCDTTQTQGPTGGTGGGTLPGNTPQQGQSVTNTEKGDGTCGGTKNLVSDKANCDVTSKRLDDVLACIKGKVVAFEYEKGTEKNIAGNFLSEFNPFYQVAFAAGKMSISIGIGEKGHITNSCHYGGRNCKGQSQAADLTGDLPALKNASIECGADSVIYNGMGYFGGTSKPYTGSNPHTGHVHISVNNAACGCDYMQ